MIDLKKLVNTLEIWNNFKFSTDFTKQGNVRIYVNDKKTKYFAKGHGYDKVSAVIAKMINDLIEKQPYNQNIYGNNGEYLSENGVGLMPLIDSLNTINVKLEEIYSGKSYDVFKIDFSKLNLTKGEM